MKTDFEIYLEEVAARTVRDGGTASKPSTRQFLPARDLWSFPKYPSRTAILPSNINLVKALMDFIAENEKYLNEEDCWLGTWLNPITQEFYLDIAMGIQDLDAAKKFAMQAGETEGRKVVAIFNSRKNQTIFLG